MNDPEREVWAAHPEWIGFYEVSTFGFVRSVSRTVRKWDGTRSVRGRVLKMNLSRGYLRVMLCRGGRTPNLSVHRLVLETFVGPCPEGMEACHADGDRGNARLTNLRWDTKKANADDRAKHKTVAIGERHGRAKLNPEKVRAIRCGLANRRTLQSLADDFGVGICAIVNIRDGRTWRHVEPA